MTDVAAASEASEWRFVAFDAGTMARRSGRVAASDEPSAIASVVSRGLVGVTVKPVPEQKARRLAAGKASERMAFLRSLALINSAVPSMNETLQIAAMQVPAKSSLRPAVDSLIEATTTGEPLEKAFARQGHIWGEDVAAVVAAGIESGGLTDALKTLVGHKQRSERIKRKVRKTFTEPIFAVLVTGAVLWLSLTKAIPEAVEFSEELDAEVPSMTQTAIDAGNFITSWGSLILLVLGAAIIALYYASQSQRYELAVSRFWLSIPRVGGIVHGQSVALATGVIALGLTAGAQIRQVVAWAAEATPNKYLRSCLRDVHDRMLAGAQFGDAVKAHVPVIPHEVAALARQSLLGIKDNGQHWRSYAEEISEATEEKVVQMSEEMSNLRNMLILTVVTYISLAATAPMLNVVVELISNPDSITS